MLLVLLLTFIHTSRCLFLHPPQHYYRFRKLQWCWFGQRLSSGNLVLVITIFLIAWNSCDSGRLWDCTLRGRHSTCELSCCSEGELGNGMTSRTTWWTPLNLSVVLEMSPLLKRMLKLCYFISIVVIVKNFIVRAGHYPMTFINCLSNLERLKPFLRSHASRGSSEARLCYLKL